MKREINLLPLDFQIQRQHQLYGRGVRQLLVRLNIGLLLMGLIFGSVYATLYVSASDPNLSSVPTGANQSEVEQSVRRANELLAAIDNRAISSVPWTPHVGQAISLLPSELSLTTITVRDTTKDLTIEGVSRSRSALVVYEQAIRALPWVDTVDSPLQNFATGKQTSFSLVIKRRAP